MDPYTKQQLGLLHKLQTNVFSLSPVELKSLFFIYFLSFLPKEERIKLYFYLTTSTNPLIHSFFSLPLPIVIILSFALFAMLLLLIISCFYVLYYLLKFAFKKTLSKFYIKSSIEKIFLEVTPPHMTMQSAFSTEELFHQLHSIAIPSSFWEKLAGKKQTLALELVATRDGGIRYLLQINAWDEDIVKKQLLSFLPGAKIARVKDYLPKLSEIVEKQYNTKVVEFRLTNHFAYPLKLQKTLAEHDPIAYITGMMTKLSKDELISLQIIISPLTSNEQLKQTEKLNNLILNSGDVFGCVNTLTAPLPIKIFKKSVKTVILLIFVVLFPLIFILLEVVGIIMFLATNEKSGWIFPDLGWIFNRKNKIFTFTSGQQEVIQGMGHKLDEQLFETTIRAFIVVNSRTELASREKGLKLSLSTFTNPSSQGFKVKINAVNMLLNKESFPFLKERELLPVWSRQLSQPINVLSVSELSSIYHLPFTQTTRTEGLVKSKSNELPAPLSFKKEATHLDVIIGKNTYGGEETPIGQTLTQRRKHTYIIGKTGMGKTEMLKSIIYQDMVAGKGLCVLDPHGDLIQDLLKIIPENRKKDVIYFDPSDRDNPIGLNILSPGIKFSNKDEADERITSSIIAIFQKLTPEEYWGPRMEHILRNATLTTLQTSIPTLWVLQQLLTDKKYQRKVSAKLSDPILKQFWEKEFATVGSMQMFSVTAPLTERIGHFITTKMSRHILLQEESAISIQKIMDEGKILLVNLSKGDLGEDQSFFFGTMITSFIWMAAYQRTKIPEKERRDFFLYVDEFQNFATKRFAEISSESRKFHVSLVVSHQNIAQIEDPNIIKIVAGNADTFIAMKAGPDDEKFILPFMDPEVEKGDIVNLPPYKFFMKVTNEDSEDAFSGETELLDIKVSDAITKEVIERSRKHYATPRKEVEAYLEKLFAEMETKTKTTSKLERTKRPPIKQREKSW